LGWYAVATFSCASTSPSWLWELLSHQLPASSWRAVIQDGTGHVVLVHTGTDKHRKLVYQQLIFSGWNAQTRAVPTTSQMPIMQELDLYNHT